MIRGVIIFLLIGTGSTLFAQYLPNTSQPYLFAKSYNPAFLGIDNFTDVKLGYKKLWSGLGTEAPSFINFNLDTRIKQPVNLLSNSFRLSNSESASKEALPKRKSMLMGFGINIFNEKVGRIQRSGGGLSFSINYAVSKKFRLAWGFNTVFDNVKFDLNQLTFREPDPFYQQLTQTANSQSYLNFQTGFLLYSNRFYVGVSYFPDYTQQFGSSLINAHSNFYKGTLQMGIAFRLSPKLVLKPSIMSIWQAENSFVTDYNAKAYVTDRLWFGITYRDTKAIISNAGISLTSLISITYSAQFSMGSTKQFGDGSHEVGVLFKFKNINKANHYAW